MEPPTASSIWTVDADGFVECPECGEKKRTGVVGVGNIQKNHVGSQICKDKAAKRKKGDNKMKNTSLLGFFQRGPRPKPVPSTMTTNSVSQTTSLAQLPSQLAAMSQTHPEPKKTSLTGTEYLRRLQHISEALPLTILKATSTDLLAQFANPATYDNPNISSDDLWEEVLNPFLKGALGWGNEIDMGTLIRRGKLGFAGLVEFVRYFTEGRGVNEALFEGKLTNLIQCAEESISFEASQHQETTVLDAINVDEIEEDVEIVSTSTNKTVSKQAYEHPIKSRPPTTCQGFVLSISNGQSPYTTYPYGLHSLRRLPWNPYVDSQGIMKLFAHGCSGMLTITDQSICLACHALQDNKILEGILTRMEHGVAENTPFLYHGISGLLQLLNRKNQRIEAQHLRGLNQARSLLGRATALADHKRFLVAIASGKVDRVDKLIRIALGQNKGIRAVLELFNTAAKGLYHPKSYTEEEEMRGLLLWRLGGSRLAYFANKALGLPSVTTLRTRSIMPPIIPSHAKPTTVEIEANIEASFESVMDVVQSQGEVLHAVLMFDEIATEKRIRLDRRKDIFLGPCREHGHRTSLEFTTADDLEELFHALDSGEVHYAAEATVGALGVLCDNNRLYPARAILISGDCKRETGAEHAVVLQTTLNGVKNQQKNIKIRIVSIASDGEKRRGSAMALLTFKNHLSPQSNIFPLLSGLTFLDLHVGDDDLTCDKDWKHLFKRLRNLLLRERGIVVAGIRITPSILRTHFISEGATAEHIRATFNPDDLQDVRIAFDMLKDIWSLPRTPSKPNVSPGFRNTRDALWIFGQVLLNLLFPFLCVELSLSEQLEHLSAAAHLAMALYRKAGKDFLPTELYTDLMLMIKNAYFCVAKAKVDTPLGSFWLILLGTDRLEQLFGILRTMVGSNVNVDIYQLVERLSGTTEISNILAKYPQWDRGPRRLKLPTITRESGQLIARHDHLTPALWKGDVKVSNVTLQTSWRRGRRMIEEVFPFFGDMFRTMENEHNITILSPSGELLVNIPLPPDDVDESLEEVALGQSLLPPHDTGSLEDQVAIEDIFAAELMHDEVRDNSMKPKSPNVIYCGEEISKIKALSLYSKYRAVASSTDRLRRVQEIGRHFSARSSTQPLDLETTTSTPSNGLLLVIQDPIASLLRCDGRYWLCIGEINGLKDDGVSVDFIEHGQLEESKVSVSYQLLGLRATDSFDDPTMKLDWRTYQTSTEVSFTVPGHLIQPINPDTSTPKSLGDRLFYLLDSRVLVALAASLFQSLAASDFKSVPKIGVKPEYPYRERLGKAAFLCRSESEQDHIDGHDLENPDSMLCPLCNTSPVFLNLKHGQRVLEHLGAHILFDKKISRADEPCGCCLRPGAICLYYLKKGKGAKGTLKIDYDRTRACPTKLSFSYSVAAEPTPTAPCSNVPVICPSCSKLEPAVWRYNLQQHYQRAHPNVDHTKYAHLWELLNFEVEEMKEIWAKRQRVVVKRVKKSNVPALVVSDAHRSQIPESAPNPGNGGLIKRHSDRDADSTDGEGNDQSEESNSEESDVNGKNDDSDGVETTNRETCDSVASFYSGLLLSDYIAENPADFAVREDDTPTAGAHSRISASVFDNGHGIQASIHSIDGTALDQRDNISTVKGLTNSETMATSDGVMAVSSTIPSAEISLHANTAIPVAVTVGSSSTGVDEDRNLAGRIKRKRKIVQIHGLNDCECGFQADPDAEDVVQCKRDGCETQWWHLACVNLELAPKNWVCRTCKSSGGGKGGKVARK